MDSNNPFEQLFGQMTGDKKYDDCGYHCTKCGYELERVVVKTIMEVTRKLFYCHNNHCERFGLLTVVANKKAKKL